MSMVVCHTALNRRRQLKLNKVDFGEILNASESAQLNLASLHLVACNGILDLGRWGNLNSVKPFVVIREGCCNKKGCFNQAEPNLPCS